MAGGGLEALVGHIDRIVMKNNIDLNNYGCYINYVLNSFLINVGRIMFKICRKCNANKSIDSFYSQRATCNTCNNIRRRSKYPPSICRYCGKSFKPGKKGQFIFCEEKCRFLNKVKKDKSGCWLWQAGIHKDGYGDFVPINGRSGLAHRTSYRLFKGTIKEGMLVLHSCNVPSCVNPEHLRLGKDKDNAQDKIRAGNSRKMPHGEKSHFSKLTDEKVLELREKAKEKITYVQLGEMFEVTECQARNIVKRRCWKHI